jgi:osmotically-inducible protein OsmY
MILANDHLPESTIASHAESQLQTSGYLELHNLRCSFREGILILMGCVSTYYLWQVALSIVQKLDGVGMVDNQVVVVNGHGPQV